MEVSWVWTILLGGVVLLLVKKYYGRKDYWKERGVPSIKSSLFTTLRLLFFSKQTFMDYVVDLYNKYKHEKYVGYVMQYPVLIVHDPELITRIIIKDFNYFEDRSMPLQGDEELVNSGLASLSGEKWRVMRHKLTPTFTSGKMKFMFSQIKECSDEFVLYLKDKQGVDLETRDFLFRFMINVVGSTAFCMKVDAFSEANSNNQFLQISKQFFQPSLITQYKVIIATMFPRLKKLLNLRIVDPVVNDFFLDLAKNLIAQRRSTGKKANDFLQLMLELRDKEAAITSGQAGSNKANVSDDALSETPEDKELLEYLKNIQHNNEPVLFNDSCIAAQTFLFISGGSETTATVLSFALHQLAVNGDIQKRLQHEIDTILQTSQFTYDAVKKMKYLEQILQEVLRLHFSGVLTRLCVQDYKVPDSDLVIEKNVVIQIPSIGMHRDAQYFPDPEKFNPDRFEDLDAIPKGVYLPFGGGPRMCIAMRLAILQMKIFLATVLSTYNVEHSEKTALPLVMEKKSLLMHVKGGLWVKFVKRVSN